jgi:hypothetical protein
VKRFYYGTLLAILLFGLALPIRSTMDYILNAVFAVASVFLVCALIDER